jgi:hypothetical protein
MNTILDLIKTEQDFDKELKTLLSDFHSKKKSLISDYTSKMEVLQQKLQHKDTLVQQKVAEQLTQIHSSNTKNQQAQLAKKTKLDQTRARQIILEALEV